MRYCINPDCVGRENPEDVTCCKSCQTPLLIQQRYYLQQSLRSEAHPYTEVFVVADLQQPERYKVMKILVSSNPKVIQLFQQEQTLLQQFRYPGIPRGEAAFSVEIPSASKTLPVLVMEKIDGITLEKWLQDYGSFDQHQAINLLSQMAHTLDYIHQRGYFHRDLKPSNIMWSSRTGQFVLLDFGSARAIERSTNRQNATMVGTPGYTAPEQWAGQAVPQSDFYALGMTVIYALTGETSDTLPSVTDWHKYSSQPLDPPLIHLIDQLIAEQPVARPPTAAALLKQIARLAPPEEPPKFRYAKLKSSIRTSQLGGLALLGLVGVLLLGNWFWTHRDPTPAPAPAGLPPEEMSPQPAPAHFKTFAAYYQGNVAQMPLGQWRYGGSTVWAAIQQRLDPVIQVVIPQFQITLMNNTPQPSTGKGIEQLITGELDFAVASGPVDEEELDKARDRGFHLEQIPVAYDAIVAVVHPDLNVTGLTIKQLVDIYTGEVTNWRELGGVDLPIQPLNGDPKGGAPRILKDYFPPGADYSPRVKLVNSPSDAVQTISQPSNPQDKGGIYFGSSINLLGQCGVKPLRIGQTPTRLVAPYQTPLISAKQCPKFRNQLQPEVVQSGDYPLTRKVFVVVRAEDSRSTKAGKAYANLLLTQQGQDLIQATGLVPLLAFPP